MLHIKLTTVATCLVFGLSALVAPAAAATDRLPDLGMAQVANLQLEKTADGHRLLHYDATIVNVGAGAFELGGQRPDTSTTTMTVTQRIYDDAGGFRDVPTSAAMYYAGDGHNHWHVRDLEVAEVDRLDNGTKVGTLAKHGFCFSDNLAFRTTLSGSPTSAFYTTCGGNPAQLTTRMGLSVGWGDVYHADTAFQYVDITGLGAGRYRLITSVNTGFGFVETNPSNDTTWADIQIKEKGNSLRVLGYGPGA
jgi:Lysyl oxidase